MEVTLDKKSDVMGTITVKVTEADYADKVKKELKEIGKTHTIPGFRAGKVPFSQLERRFGRQVKSDVLNHEVYNAVIDYIQKEKLNVLGEPLPVEVKEVNLDDKDYTFQYEIGLAPEIDVKLGKDVKLPYVNIAVSDEMYKEQDAALCERFGAQVPGEEADDKAVIKGSIQQLNADGTVNENPGAIQVVSGIIAPFTFASDEQKKLFLGKKVNDKVRFNPFQTCGGNAAEIASMLNIDKEIAKDMHDDFEMAISEIIVVKPAEHNQELYDNVFGKDKVTDEAGYEKAVREMIANSLKGNSEAWFDHEAEEYLVKEYGDMELPVEFLKKWLVARNEELTDQNIDEEFVKMLPSLKWQLVKERVAEALNVKIEEEDVLNYAKSIAYRQFAQYGITNMDDQTIEETAKRILADKNYRQQIVSQVGDAKLFAAIKDAVTLDEKTVSLDEFKAMVAPKEDAE